MTLPPEALLLRRMEGLLFQIASTLRAEARWGALLRELIEGGEPVGELGASTPPGSHATSRPPQPVAGLTEYLPGFHRPPMSTGEDWDPKPR